MVLLVTKSALADTTSGVVLKNKTLFVALAKNLPESSSLQFYSNRQMTHVTQIEQGNSEAPANSYRPEPSEGSDSQLAYWKQQLANAPSVLELPSDRPRSPMQTVESGKHELELPQTLTEALKALSQQEESTLFITLLAALKVLLYRYTGQEDMIVGCPIAKCNVVENEEQIGARVNPLALRTNLSSNPSFNELLARVCQVVLEAKAYQDLPFEKLVEALQPEQNLSHPLFQVMFVFQDASALTHELPNFSWHPLALESGTTTKLDLTLFLQETAQGITGWFEYNPDLFEAATLIRMTGHYQTLLEGIVANPNQRLSDLPLLTAGERHQLLVEWNCTQVDYPNLLIHQLFEAQVERTPDAVALVFEDQQLTYQELNHRANQLAHHLQSLGVKPDVLVALCVERSLEMVVGLLGILKAGGGYIPLDPSYPQERVAFMLSDAQVPVLLTQKTLMNGLPELEAHITCLDTDWEIISQESNENLVSDVTGDNLAYVIYTSGSTGKPKGVQLCHRSVINFLHSMAQQPGLTDQDILLAVTTISFDIAVLELYLPLITGAKVILVSREVAANGAKLLEKLVSSGATIMQATPATWRLLLVSGWDTNHRLKILCGGEAMPRELASQLLERSTSLWNVYGPTETTVWSTAYKVEASRLVARSKDAPESIGRPIANTQIYLLDAYLQPVPIGVPGELHIGGAGLARGYLNRPELTQEKFIPDPFSNEPEARLYKTGDLARYLPDGNIDYISRIDHQVKIRGFRIELGEIEAVLAQHPAVRQAVVIAREDVPGDKRLVAYMVPNQEQVPTTSELRRFLKEQLTDYMVPAAFVWLDTLPLTPNGKVDRRALPAPNQMQSTREETFVAPQDDLEFQLTKIWEEVLGIEPIGVRDNLFSLGAHSLLIARLSDQIQKAFNKHLPLTTIFQAPTVEQLATILRQEGWSAVEQALTAIQPNGSKPPLFLCEGVSIYYPLVPYLGLAQPLYGLVAPSSDRKSATQNLIKELAAQYIQEIRTLQPEGPYYLAGLSFGGIVAFEMAQQLTAQGQEVALLALFDTILSDAYKPLPSYKRACYHLRQVYQKGPAHILIQLKERTRSLKSKLMRIYSKFYLERGEEVLHTLEYHAMREVNEEAERSYRPQVYPSKVILFRAANPVDAQTSCVAPDGGWGKLAAGGVQIYEVPGDHLGILKEPHIKVIAENLKSCLDKAHAMSTRSK